MPFFTSLAAAAKSAAKEIRNVRSLVGGALMAALNVVLNSIGTVPVSNMLEISFAFLTLLAGGYLYGPWVAALVGGIADIIGFLLRPNGAFFFGFTLNEILRGILFGLWLYKRPVALWRVIGACVCSTLLISFVLNPIWLHMMYGAALFSVPRMVTAVVKLPVDILLGYGLLRVVEKYNLAHRA